MKSTLLRSLFLSLIITALLCGCSEDSDPGPALVSCFELPDTLPKANEPVVFTSCSKLAASYLWEFGDGSTSSLESPEHTYTSEGEFTVKLTVTDDHNGTQTSTQVLSVLAPECQSHYTGFMTQSETWGKGCHIVKGWIQIEDGAVLTIAPGAVVKFEKGADLIVGSEGNGALIAEGTEAEPILFTSIQATPAPGDWDGVIIGGTSSTPSSFKYCVFEYGGIDLFDDPSAMMAVNEGGRVSVDHCEFSKCNSYALSVDHVSGFELFTNNYIHDVNEFALFMTGNNAGTIGEGNTIENKGVLIDAYQVTVDTKWRGLTCPYVTSSNLWVGSENGNTLTLDAGVRIEFQNSQMLLPTSSSSIATLIANGTAENPVVLTAHDPQATTRWGGVSLSDRFTADTYFRYTIFEKAQSSYTNNAVISVGATTLNMENCSISGSKPYGIMMGAGATLGVFSNNDFGEISGFSMYIQLQNLEKIADGNTFSGNKDVDVGLQELTTDIVWPALPVNYYIDRDLWIGSPTGNTVTLSPGVKFLMVGSTLKVGQGYNALDPMPGTLHAVGTAENPIVLKRVAVPNNDYPMIDFSGLDVGPESIMEYCHIIGGTNGIRVDNLYNDAASPFPAIRNNTISDCTNSAIYVSNSYPLIENNTYTNNGLNGAYYQ